MKCLIIDHNKGIWRKTWRNVILVNLYPPLLKGRNNNLYQSSNVHMIPDEDWKFQCEWQCWNIGVYDFVDIQKLKIRSVRNSAELTSCTARKYRHWNLSNTSTNQSIALSCEQSQIVKLVVLTNANQWNLANTDEKLNKFNTLSSEQSQSVKLVMLANAKRWNLTNTVEKLNKSNAPWEPKRSGNPVATVEWL